MMANEQDWVVIFNLKRIEEAVKNGEASRRSSGVPRPRRPPRLALTRYVPVPNSPHGINTAPDGIHFVANGKLSPTVTVFDARKLDDLFDDKIQPRDVVVAEPELGLGPLHTAYDGKGNAFTTLFLDSQIVKWNIDLAKRAFKGEKVNPILQKLDVHYQPGHNHTSMGQTKEADGKWLISLNKFSKDRFLNVGPLKPENDQLIDISGDQMVLVHDGPSFAEPHDATIVHRSKINPLHVWKRDDPFFADAVKQAKADGIKLEADYKVIRDGNKVRVYMTSSAPAFGLDELHGQTGRRGHGLRHQHRRRRGPDPRLLHRELRHQHGDRTAADLSVTFTADRARRLLVLLLLVLPRDAHGDARPHAGRATERLSHAAALASNLAGAGGCVDRRRGSRLAPRELVVRPAERLQAALDRAADGDTVVVEGEHRGRVRIDAQDHARGASRAPCSTGTGPRQRRHRCRSRRRRARPYRSGAPGGISRRWMPASSLRRPRPAPSSRTTGSKATSTASTCTAPRTRLRGETRSSASQEGRINEAGNGVSVWNAPGAKVDRQRYPLRPRRHLRHRQQTQRLHAATVSATCASPSTTCTPTTARSAAMSRSATPSASPSCIPIGCTCAAMFPTATATTVCLFNFANSSEIIGNVVSGRLQPAERWSAVRRCAARSARARVASVGLPSDRRRGRARRAGEMRLHLQRQQEPFSRQPV